jgi:hypothetical protein
MTASWRARDPRLRVCDTLARVEYGRSEPPCRVTRDAATYEWSVSRRSVDVTSPSTSKDLGSRRGRQPLLPVFETVGRVAGTEPLS